MPYIHQHAHINYSFHQILELLTHTRWSRIVLSTQYFTDCGIRRCTCVCVCVCVCSDFLSKLSRVERERERERERECACYSLSPHSQSLLCICGQLYVTLISQPMGRVMWHTGDCGTHIK